MRGRVSFSESQTFQVDVDGTPPSVTVEANHRNPVAGELVTFTARAQDEANIPFVDLHFSASPSWHRCRYTSSNNRRVCRITVSAPADRNWIRFKARAFDEDGYTGESINRYALYDGPDDTDTDDDGLPDALENTLCTSASDPDTDLDGLVDSWEVVGLEFDDGWVTDLPGLGAEPCRRDVFFQYDGFVERIRTTCDLQPKRSHHPDPQSFRPGEHANSGRNVHRSH